MLMNLLFALDPSSQPPGGLSPSEVPQFVFIGSDDQNISPQWLVNLVNQYTNPAGSGNSETYDGTMAKISLYSNSINGWSSGWFYDHRLAYEQGNELGNHTATHIHMDTYETNITKLQDNMATSYPSDLFEEKLVAALF